MRDIVGDRIDKFPESVRDKHAAIVAENAKIPRVSSHDLARRLLALPDCSALILWGSYYVPIQMNTDDVAEFKAVTFYG